jgi:hypothetical protein
MNNTELLTLQLQSVYGDLTENVISKVIELHNALNGALLTKSKNLVYPEFSDNSFISQSGQKYIIDGQISQKRFEHLENIFLQIELGLNTNPGLFAEQMENLLNAGQVVKASQLLGQFQDGLNYRKNVPELVVLACTLFIRKDGDTSDWNESDAKEVIKDWQSIPYAFFLVSLECFKAVFMEICKAGFQNTLRVQQPKTDSKGFFNKLLKKKKAQ